MKSARGGEEDLSNASLDGPRPENRRAFEKHIFLTYHHLRITMAATCVLLAVGVVALGACFPDVKLQPTLSDYYYSEVPPAYLRTAFVGLLAILGAMLIAYRGYTTVDNQLHNAAGIFAVCVAIFPTKCPYLDGDANLALCVRTPWPTLHLLFALFVFVIAIVSIAYGGGRRFQEVLSKPALKTLILARWISGFTILAGVLIPVCFLVFDPPTRQSQHSWILFGESCAFLGFGAYWTALTWCVSETNSERKEARRKRRLAKAVPPSAQPTDEAVLLPGAEELPDIP